MERHISHCRVDQRGATELQNDAPRERGVLLVNVGTPDGPDIANVRRYIAEFLSDPLVIQLPRAVQWLQRPLARLIARRRAPHSAEKYRSIWTERGSPLKAIMEDQAAALADELPCGWRVFLGMRYGRPSISEALREIASHDIEELVIVPLYPQFSQTATGTVVDEVYRVIKEAALHTNVTTRTTWYDDADYLNAQAQLIAEHARSNGLDPDNAFLVFSAHGLPVSYIRRGDPYQRQLAHSVRLVAERLGWSSDRYTIAYQSRMGPNEWLKPDLTTTLKELAEKDESRVLVCPISFVSDCLETLEEIQIRAHADFAASGGELFVCPALNTYGRFISALKNLIVRGPHPVSSWSSGHKPLFRTATQGPPADSGLAKLVMVGASLPNRVGEGRGPRIAHSEPAAFACAKRPHHEVQAFLESLRSERRVREAFIWNTCHRFECYAWLEPSASSVGCSCVAGRLRTRLFNEDVSGLNVNMLFGSSAWHHLMRTVAGLNSGLPGDTDVVEQLKTSYQLAERAGIGGEHSRALVDEATELSRGVRKETSWGRLEPGYCSAAITRIQRMLPLRLANCRHVVIGGSTTSRSILRTLYQRFAVKESNVTLVYRNHQGGQMKSLRRAVGHGRRLRTQDYSDRAVIEAVADADVVHFGIDREEPVLSADVLCGLRDYAQRPLFILDFNTAGSTEGLETLPGVRLWRADQLDAEVQAYAEASCADQEFPQIVQETEAWIEGCAPTPIVTGLDLPCQRSGDSDHPPCGSCAELVELVASGSES